MTSITHSHLPYTNSPEQDFLKQSYLINLSSYPILTHPIPFISSRMSISLLLASPEFVNLKTTFFKSVSQTLPTSILLSISKHGQESREIFFHICNYISLRLAFCGYTQREFVHSIRRHDIQRSDAHHNAAKNKDTQYDDTHNNTSV